MVLTLFGNPQSGCTKRVATVLYEKQVPFTFVDVDLVKGEQFTPDHLEKQPFAKVPYIDDDGFILYESRAICRYIEKKYPDQGTKGLIPTDPKAEALFEQAASIELCNFNPYATGAVYEALVKPRFLGQPTDPKAVASLLANLEKSLDVYEKILSKQKYLSGDAITLADLFHIPPAVALPATGSTAMQTRPNVARWFKDLTERPSWKKVLEEFRPKA
ncbi:glutathione S-transferase [Ephemerocybe angulata]|uniref:glutathione transferase n=1 Tax=Ephemerocybe angulata TaxID=980116 RepID=A0A8H6I2X5_9AGAR|nr:glutathione S-transferase [Tulosesus angulatus]